jgi:membrane protein HdeD
MEGRNMLTGILAIILGLLVIAFPVIGVWTISVIAGFSIIILGIWLIIQAFELRSAGKAAGIANVILGVIAIIIGLGLFGNILAFSFLASFFFYFAGFFLLISGIMALVAGEGTSRTGVGGLGVVLGILYIILGAYAWNPLYLALLIGVFLIVYGISRLFARTAAE